jgi:hypothetical protein
MGDKTNFTIKMSKRTIRHRTELIEKNEEDDTMYSCSLFEYDIFLCQHRTSNSAFVGGGGISYCLISLTIWKAWCMIEHKPFFSLNYRSSDRKKEEH